MIKKHRESFIAFVEREESIPYLKNHPLYTEMEI